MKLNICFLFATLASLATAVPASFSISVSVNDGSLRNSIHKPVDACILPCWPKQMQCGEGSYAWQSGECWFCCLCSARPRQPQKDAESFATSLVAQGIRDVGKYHPENMPLIYKGPAVACWAICSDSPLLCGKGWYSEKSGSCWTCCSCPSAPRDSITGTGYELPAETNAEIDPLAEDL